MWTSWRRTRSDSADLIADKIRKAKSDAIVGITCVCRWHHCTGRPQVADASTLLSRSWDPEERPEVANLLTMMSVFEGRSVEDLCAECQVRGGGVTPWVQLWRER